MTAAVPTAGPLRPVAPLRQRLGRAALGLALLALLAQALRVTQARPQDLVSGAQGMWDILRRATPPTGSVLGTGIEAAVETFDIALVGTVGALVLALPLAVCAAENLTPARALYHAARAVIALCRVVPDLIWALLFVTAVGLGPFPGALAVVVHSVGMLGRLFAETFEEMDMAPVHALEVGGATRTQVVTHAVLPGTLPSLVGIALYRLDENVRSSLVLGFVGAGGIGFQILSAMNLFQYRKVSTFILITFVLVLAVERASATLRRRIH